MTHNPPLTSALEDGVSRLDKFISEDYRALTVEDATALAYALVAVEKRLRADATLPGAIAPSDTAFLAEYVLVANFQTWVQSVNLLLHESHFRTMDPDTFNLNHEDLFTRLQEHAGPIVLPDAVEQAVWTISREL